MLIVTCSSSCCTLFDILLNFCWNSGQVQSHFGFCCLKAKFMIFQVPAQTGREYGATLGSLSSGLSIKISHGKCFSSEHSNGHFVFTWKKNNKKCTGLYTSWQSTCCTAPQLVEVLEMIVSTSQSQFCLFLCYIDWVDPYQLWWWTAAIRLNILTHPVDI